jgi:hypothetical protein
MVRGLFRYDVTACETKVRVMTSLSDDLPFEFALSRSRI